VHEKKISPEEASELISMIQSSSDRNATDPQDELLRSFANLDHHRSKRTGFPEAVFSESKTPEQVAKILDDMARSVNELSEHDSQDQVATAILATR
jgi:NCAIR mutase (PurE)-related protein